MPPRPADLLRLLVNRPRTLFGLLRFVAGTLVPVQKAFARGDDERAMHIFGQGVLGKMSYERLPEARIEQMRENRSTLRAFMMSDADFPPLGDDDVRGVRAPVLLVTGELSPRFAIDLTDRLEELLPNTERVEISAASHVMHEENAPALNEAIVGFLGRHGLG